MPWLGVLSFGVGLFGYIYAGVFSRFMKDDYCYAVAMDRRDFLDGQMHAYLSEVTFSGNRFSLNLGMGLSELAGRWTVPFLPGMMIVLWLLALCLLVRVVKPLGSDIFGWSETVLAAAAIALFSIALAPNWVQVIYWRPGMFPYFAPIVFGTWLLVSILGYRESKWAIPHRIGIFLLAVLVGGFSEVGNAVEVAALILAMGKTIVTGDKKQLTAHTLGLAGALVAFALLVLSPVTGLRSASLYGGHASLVFALSDSLQSTVIFYVALLYRSTLLYLSAFIFFCLFSLIVRNAAEGQTPAPKAIFLRMMTWLGLAIALTWAAMLPSSYAEFGAPGERVLVIPSFINILLAAGLGYGTGQLLSLRSIDPRWAQWGRAALWFAVLLSGGLWLGALQRHFVVPSYPDLRTFVQANGLYAFSLLAVSILVAWGVSRWFKGQAVIAVLLLCYLCQPLLIAGQIYAQVPALQERARLWDAREAQILDLRAQGVTNIEVRALDSLAGISELSSKPGNWVNTCAAKYYRIESIKALEPVLNPPEP